MPSPTQSKIDQLIELAAAGPIRAREVTAAGIPRAYLGRLCERGVLERVGRGLYRREDAATSEFGTLAEVTKRVPRAVIGLLSALQFHGLTSEVPGPVWILLDARARTPEVRTPRLEVVRASGAALDHGVETHRLDGVDVRLTTPAKTVADCFRFRRHIGLDVALDALRDYLARRAGGIDELITAARADRVWTVVRPYLEALT